MAASLREGADGSFSGSLKSDEFLRLNREDARRFAKARHLELHAAKQDFVLPDPAQLSPAFGELLRSHHTVGVFAGVKSWFEVVDFERWLRAASPQPLVTCYPRANVDSFDFRASSGSELSKEPPYGLFEPSAQTPIAQPSLIFVPCTLADRLGHRIGRGKGHFDRYLARHPGVVAVGVCHEDFLLDEFPATWTQAHDKDMNVLLSNKNFFIIANQRRP